MINLQISEKFSSLPQKARIQLTHSLWNCADIAEKIRACKSILATAKRLNIKELVYDSQESSLPMIISGMIEGDCEFYEDYHLSVNSLAARLNSRRSDTNLKDSHIQIKNFTEEHEAIVSRMLTEYCLLSAQQSLDLKPYINNISVVGYHLDQLTGAILARRNGTRAFDFFRLTCKEKSMRAITNSKLIKSCLVRLQKECISDIFYTGNTTTAKETRNFSTRSGAILVAERQNWVFFVDRTTT